VICSRRGISFNMARKCKFGCGKSIEWDDNLYGRVKFKEVDTGKVHDFPRCRDVQEENSIGKKVSLDGWISK
jgi:hypothetical protein